MADPSTAAGATAQCQTQQNRITAFLTEGTKAVECRLVHQFSAYIPDARHERFEDGMSSTFAARVHESIMAYGAVAVAAWERVMLRTGNAYETGEELLRQIGLVEHPPSHSSRLPVLTDSVRHFDPAIRDAAGLGLSFLNDPAALPQLREASASETEQWIQRNLALVIAQLENPICCST